ncbi:type II toxin-antitoxin system RelE/ParE family toxin [Alteriqipengyuania sp. 357]
MRELRLSRKAAADLSDIADFTIAEFGIEQARKYRDQFAKCFASLLDNPMLGRSADELAPGLRRIRQQAHVVFYEPSEEAVLIVRVLHHRMDFEQHL